LLFHDFGLVWFEIFFFRFNTIDRHLYLKVVYCRRELHAMLQKYLGKASLRYERFHPVPSSPARE
jgi:hypothetical protein